MLNVLIRKLDNEDQKKALSLVWKVFLEYEAPDYFPQTAKVCKKPVMEDLEKSPTRTGFIHIAFSVGSKEKVDELTARLKSLANQEQLVMDIMKAV